MTIFELGALGEFIGSILMLGTLVYLAFQVRQAKQLAQTSIALERGAASRQINGMLLTTPELLKFQIEAYKRDGTLESSEVGTLMTELDCGGEEALTIACWHYIAVRAIEVAFLTEEDKERSKLSVRNVYGTSLVRIWWEHANVKYSPDFVRFVDGILSEWPLDGNSRS